MTYAAKIQNDYVIEIIVGDYEWANANLDGIWVDCTTNDNDVAAAVGYVYDETTNQFSLPPKPEPIIEPIDEP